MENTSMDIPSVLTIIISVGILMAAFANLINSHLSKRFDDFKELFLSEIKSMKADQESFKELLKAEIGSIRSEIGSIRSEFKTEIGSMRSEIGSIRSEFKTEIGSMRSEFKAELKLVHETLNNHINSEIKANRDEIRALDQKIDRVDKNLEELIKRSKD